MKRDERRGELMVSAVKSRSRQTASNPSCIVCVVFLGKKLFYTSAFYRLGETVCIAHAKLPGLSIENNFLGQRTWCVTSGSLFSVPPKVSRECLQV